MKEAVLFHTHGIDGFDFSDIGASDLTRINEIAAESHTHLCATVYLTQAHFAAFGDLMRTFAELKSAGALPCFIGFAIEGPVLGPKGGTPTGSVWRPTGTQWLEMVGWFSLGLKYVVIAPDVLSLDEEVDSGLTFGDLLTLIYDSGGRVALGHFGAHSADQSVTRLHEVLAHIEGSYEPGPYLVLTDHLFNDMPRAFRHAFRSPSDREQRQAELERLLVRWTPSALPSLLGPLPAALLAAAVEQRLTPSLNFDGGHVDLEICRRVVDYLGEERIIAITDHTEVCSLAGEELSKDHFTGLLYRSDGVLAASSVTQEQQRENMRSIGLSESAINLAFSETPLAALSFVPCKRRSQTIQA